MEIRIENKPLEGHIHAPLAKSPAHRYLIASALSSKEISLKPSIQGEDLEATLDCLQKLGFEFQLKEQNLIAAANGLLNKETAKLNCHQSGTSLRLLLPLIGALGIKAEVIGEGNLPKRPINHLVSVLKEKGMKFTNEILPLKVEGHLKPGDFILPGDISSQYFSGLLMALPLLDGDSRVYYSSPLQSKGYVDLTIAILKEYSIEIKIIDQGFYVPGKQNYLGPDSIDLPGDWSGSSFYLVAGGAKDIAIAGLKENSYQSDEFILKILKQWGAKVEVNKDEIKVSPKNRMPLNLDMSQHPDLAPVLSLLAAVTPGQSILTGLHRLRYKESDRLQGIIKMLQALQVEFNYDEDSDLLEILGQPYLKGCTIDGQKDHRLIMTGAVAAVYAQEPITITNAQGVEKSYPMFFKDYQKLGGSYYVLTDGEKS